MFSSSFSLLPQSPQPACRCNSRKLSKRGGLTWAVYIAGKAQDLGWIISNACGAFFPAP